MNTSARGAGDGGSVTVGASNNPLILPKSLTGTLTLISNGAGSGIGGNVLVQAADMPAININASANGGSNQARSCTIRIATDIGGVPSGPGSIVGNIKATFGFFEQSACRRDNSRCGRNHQSF